MKLSPAELERRLLRPGDLPRAILLHGEDAARVVQLRDAVIAAVAGPSGEADMRIDRLAGSALRSAPGLLETTLRSQGFFPGVRVVVLGEATDGLADLIVGAARSAVGIEAALVATAGALPERSALRRGFEGERTCAAVHCAGGPADAAEISAALDRHGIGEASDPAVAELVRLSGEMDRLSLNQLIAKIALWQREGSGPLGIEGVVACAAPDGSTDADRLVLAVLRRDVSALSRLLSAQMPASSGGVSTILAMQRVLRQVLDSRLLMDDEGISAGAALARLFPPVPAQMQQALGAVTGTWGRIDLERLIMALHDLDARFRSEARQPERAMLERTLLRAMMATQR